MRIGSAEQQAYAEHGYFLVPDAVPPEALEALRREAALAVEHEEAQLRAKGDAQHVSHAGRRYFVPFRSRSRPALRDYVHASLLEEVCRATVGPEAYLFCEMFVVKPAEVGLPFGWHQDSGFLDYFKHGDFAPYVTTWLALDDMTVDNGTLFVLPFSAGGSRTLVPHRLDEATNDKVADFGPDPGRPLEVRAGTLVVLSSLLPHRSGDNVTGRPRTAYIVQFSPAPVLYPNGAPILMAEPYLRGGARCASA